MTEQSKTIAVVGSSPFALLLAGLMAADHSRQIVLVTGETDPNRLTRNISLSVAPVTRPQTWAHLRANGSETLRRISRIAPGAVTRLDVVFAAHRPELVTGLGHVHHMAAGFGHVVERPNDHRKFGARVLVRDIFAISGTVFAKAAQSWLEKSGVRIVRDPSAVRLRRNGTARVGDEDVDLAVLADDEAIEIHLGEVERAAIGVATPMLSVLTAPVAARACPVTLHLDAGVAIAQNGSGSLEIVGPGAGYEGLGVIAGCLEPGLAPQRAAQTAFTRLMPHDGAPVIGMVGRGRAFVATGLGPLDMMLAPLVARAICGRARGTEQDWLKSHEPGGRQSRNAVVDLASLGQGEGAL